MIHKRIIDSEAALEKLRLRHTGLNQDEFANVCGIPRATYHRLIRKPVDEMKITLPQIAKIAYVCNLSVDEMLKELGITKN